MTDEERSTQLTTSLSGLDKATDELIATTDRLIAINGALIKALLLCWEFIDGIADGAPDAGTNPRKANELWAPVKDALEKAGVNL